MTQDQTEDTLLLAYAVRGAKALEEDKRFDGVKPLAPFRSGALWEGGEKFVTITAVDAGANEIYEIAFSRQMATEVVEHFTEYLSRWDEEGEANGHAAG